MRAIPIFLIFFLVSEMSAYTITQVEQLKGKTVKKVKFDAEGNVYALACDMDWEDSGPQFKNCQLYRTSKNPNEASSATVGLTYNVKDMLVSSRGDTYFRFEDGPNNGSLSVIRANWTEFKVIDETLSSDLFYLDDNDNLFYGKEKGFYVLRPDSTAAVPIGNLEEFSSFGKGVISDKAGNVYFPVKNKENCTLALVPKKSLQEIPHATFINVVQNSNQKMHDAVVDEENNLWLTIADLESNEGVIKKLSNGTFKTVFTDKGRPYLEMTQLEDKIYITGSGEKCKNGKIYYITVKDEVVDIPELETLSGFCWIGIQDGKGKTYFLQKGSIEELSRPKFVTIEPNETKPIIHDKFRIRGRTINIKSANIDFNDDLWIITTWYIHRLKKGETVPVVLEDIDEICRPSFNQDVHFNSINKKAYVNCNKGLLVLENL